MNAAVVCALAALAACNDTTSGSGGATNNRSAIPEGYLGATISGLSSTGLVLKVDIGGMPAQSESVQLGRTASRLLAVRCSGCNWAAPASTMVNVPVASTSQQLAISLTPGTSYIVTVQQQPVGEICKVEGGIGTIRQANAANVVVTCAVLSYSVGGSITGLTASGLVLVDNGGDALTLDANATQFTMNSPVAYGSHYAITVQAVPTGLVCDVSNGTGTMAAANVTSISIGCLPNFTLLHSFAGGTGDGSVPYHSLIQANDGLFYGTTWYGGASNGGTVYAVTASGTASVFYSFAATPFSGLMQASDGNFYGTTANKGAYGRGTVFKITPTGTETILFSFPTGSSDPYTGVIQGSDGNFYGTTGAGGSANRGTVFELTPAGVETVLHAFPTTTTTDGQEPYAGLIQGSDGNFYGTTYFGGTANSGVVFEVTPSGTESVLHSFTAGNDGANPYAGVIQGSDGNFYGTTYSGGSHGFGTIYKLTPSGTETVLYSFAGGSSDGAYPEAGLTLASDGNFYGATSKGGPDGLGTIFRITPSGTESILHDFAGGSSDGANPIANLVQAADGNLYGATAAGGSSNDGTFFEVALH